MITYTFLYVLSIKTNWFHFSLTTFAIAFFCGSLMEFIISENGWND